MNLELDGRVAVVCAASKGLGRATAFSLAREGAKLAICARDPFETGERRTLNLGHTIGHALEIESGYRLKHGAAVALGMRSVAAIAARRGADPALPTRLDDLLGTLGYRLHHAFDESVVRTAMRRDKKRVLSRPPPRAR